jgi:hypothetical protein
LAAASLERSDEPEVKGVIDKLQEKFTGPEDIGARQVVEFFNSPTPERRAVEARRAFELVQAFPKAL